MEGLTVIVIPAFAGILLWWMLSAQFQYINAYRALHMEELRASPDRGDRLLADPHWWADSSFALRKRLWRLGWTPQPDVDLERLRTRALARWGAGIGIGQLGIILWLVAVSRFS